MQFTVKQDKGKDSLVEITETIITGWPRDRKALIFTTDQSLQSTSDRTWNVAKAIKDYANPLGYQHSKSLDEKYSVTFIYDESFHSGQVEFAIRKQVQADSRYQKASEVALQSRDDVNKRYGTAIRQLKNLIYKLEQQNQNELHKIKTELIQTQVEIVNELGIPPEVNEHHRKFLLEPHYPYTKIDTDSYDYYGQKDVLPDGDINWMLELV